VENAGWCWARAAPLDDEFLLSWWNAGDLLVAFINDRGALVDEPLKIPGVRAFGVSRNMIITRDVAGATPDLERVFVRVVAGAPPPRRRAVR
jgi:hypothetical protein